MKKLVLILIAALALVGCEDREVSRGRKLYKAYLEKFMKDPSSLVIYNETYKKDGEFTVEWVVDYGGKNGFGGMSRETLKARTTVNLISIEGGGLYSKDELE